VSRKSRERNREDREEQEDQSDQESREREEGILELLDEQSELLDSIDAKLTQMIMLQRETNDSLRNIVRTQDTIEAVAHIARVLKRGNSQPETEIIKNVGSSG
jgi:hypothetical protein